MKKTNLFLLVIILFLVSCGNVGKILRNEKIKTTDEFLVKKKEPLILPPNLEKIPEPGTIAEGKIKDEKSDFKKILKENNKKDTIRASNSSSVEESILNKIPK